MIKRTIIAIILTGLFVFLGSNVFAEENSAPEENGEWTSFTSDYFTVYCRPDANFKAIERRLRTRSGFYLWGGSGPDSTKNVYEKIAWRLDFLFRRVKDILGMYPRIEGMEIKIFKNKKELNDEYSEIMGEENNLTSFYIHRYETIYTNERDISDSVLAHEMAHAIVDHYFIVTPPEEIREILSEYVDLHLDDDY